MVERRWRPAGWLWLALLLTSAVASSAADKLGPGAYCPLPEKGRVSECLAPAQATYGDFFDALEENASDGALARVEDAVARGPEEEDAYLALSSLSYGYYRLAQRAAESETIDPAVTRRLNSGAPCRAACLGLVRVG